MEYNVDVAVLLIFFSRPDKFKKVFEQVRKARPSKLFLYQDGPRDNRADDIVGIKACREIAESIDWECEIYRNYQEKNVGCDPSEYNAIKWMFSIVDKGIILEDDDVPSVSFFRFCKEMLDKYEYDTRIFKISGMNSFERYNDEYADYFFTQLSSIWGWATWRRTIDMLDTQYSFLSDNYLQKQMKMQIKEYNEKLSTCTWHHESGIMYYESVLWNTQMTNHMLNIVPSKNLISNIGIGSDGTHSNSSLKTTDKNTQRMFYIPTYELDFPLRHPSHVIADVSYYERMCNLLNLGHPVLGKIRQWDGQIRRFIYADAEERKKKIKNQFRLLIKRR